MHKPIPCRVVEVRASLTPWVDLICEAEDGSGRHVCHWYPGVDDGTPVRGTMQFFASQGPGHEPGIYIFTPGSGPKKGV